MLFKLRLLLIAGIALLGSVSAHAQSVRTFVATGGVDNPNCFLSAPCRTFTAAIAAVGPGGEVVALDSGGYGPFTIDKSVTVLAPAGVYAAIAASSGNAITVTVGSSDTVILRNLQLYGQGGDIGISFTAGGELFVERSVVHGFAGTGISALAFGTHVFVNDSVVRNNGTHPQGHGLHVSSATASVDGSVFTGNVFGVFVGNYSSVSITRTLVAGSANYNVYPGNSKVVLEESVLAHAASGIWTANTIGVTRISNNAFIGHVGGLAISQGGGAVIESRQNNFAGQQSSTMGTITPISGQ